MVLAKKIYTYSQSEYCDHNKSIQGIFITYNISGFLIPRNLYVVILSAAPSIKCKPMGWEPNLIVEILSGKYLTQNYLKIEHGSKFLIGSDYYSNFKSCRISSNAVSNISCIILWLTAYGPPKEPSPNNSRVSRLLNIRGTSIGHLSSAGSSPT